MSELIITGSNRYIRRHLLNSVSALTLLALACNTPDAKAEGSDGATVWVELGASLDRIDGGQGLYEPPYLATGPRPDFSEVSPLESERSPRYGIDASGKILFAPKGMDWVFSAALRYGRSNTTKHIHQEGEKLSTVGGIQNGNQAANVTITALFNDTKTQYSEGHTVADFMAGRDVGIGMFGHGTSSINAGVRFAQFTLKSHIHLSSNPDIYVQRVTKLPKYVHFPKVHHYSYFASLNTERSFSGIGPSLSWEASAPFLGNRDGGEIGFDWGINGALLFGRQKTSGSSQITEHDGAVGSASLGRKFVDRIVYRNNTPLDRSQTVTVPNVGGFAGISWRYSNAKVAFGYRGDFFFNAMDGGYGTRADYNRSFYGPYATIRIGLGD